MQFYLVSIIIFVFGIFIGWRIREYIAVIRINKATTDATENLKSIVVDVIVEEHGGMFFIYKKEDRSYLAHASNLESLEDILLEKFPGKLFNATIADLERLKSR